MRGVKQEGSAQKMLAQILKQLDKVAPSSSLLPEFIKEIPGIERDISEKELRKLSVKL